MIFCLYVDDDEDLLKIVKQILERHPDIQVDTCLSTFEAMERLRSFSYDVIISDHGMPFFTGLEFLQMVRSEFGDVPFILFTSRDKNEISLAKGFTTKSAAYLQKNGDPRFLELLRLIRSETKGKQSKNKVDENVINYQYAEKMGRFGYLIYYPGTETVTISHGLISILGITNVNWPIVIAELHEMTLPEYHSALDANMKNLIDQGNPVNYEFRVKRKSDGEILDLYLNAEYLTPNNRVFGFVQDITSIKLYRKVILQANH